MNEIVNQHNDLIDLPLRRFNASEIDILQAVCYRCQNEGTREIVIPFEQLRQLSHYQAKDENRFLEDIKETNSKLLQLNFCLGDERKWVQFALFPTFEVDAYKQTLTVEVHKKFAYLLNQLSGNYTSLELRESATLKSSYAKAIYKKLRQFRTTGKWIVTLEDFKEYLDVPASYPNKEITRVVINPSVAELKNYFENLSCKPYYKKNTTGRGRPSVAGYEFTFKKVAADPQDAAEKMAQKAVPRIAEKTGWTPIGKFCPVCHKEIYQKEMHNENGMYFLLGHPDFKTGSCNWTSTDWSSVLTKDQVQEQETPKENTLQMQENKKKLDGLLSGLFGKK
jgi:plasmid replication initiation protein